MIGTIGSSRFTILFIGALGAIVWLANVGCQPNVKKDVPDATAQTAPDVSKIPLRVWVVGPLAEPELFQRQWLAGSEQPLELRSLTIQELLQLPRCQCDVLIYPAVLMGELIQRGWIVKLSPSASQSAGSEVGENQTAQHPAAWDTQAEYGGEAMGVSLSCAVPIGVASETFKMDESNFRWDEALKQLQVEATETPKFDFQAADVDSEALVDRFLALVASLSERDPGYGMLYELQSMKSRLVDSEYRQAAAILAALAAQPDGLASVLGSHSSAWTWVATRQTAALAIASPALLDSQATAVSGGQLVSIRNASMQGELDANQDAGDVTSSGGSQRPRIAWWSTGAGLVASQSSDCRQTNQAHTCLRWLHNPTTVGVLTKLIRGVESSSLTAGSETLSDRAEQMLGQKLTAKELSLEPRLPSATEYRQTLADELQQFLSGKKSAEQALLDASQRWDEISAKVGRGQRRNYEQSLNL